MSGRAQSGVAGLALVVAATLAACSSTPPGDGRPAPADPDTTAAEADEAPQAGPPGRITVAFSGDVHFEAQVSELLTRPRGALGPIARTQRRWVADRADAADRRLRRR